MAADYCQDNTPVSPPAMYIYTTISQHALLHNATPNYMNINQTNLCKGLTAKSDQSNEGYPDLPLILDYSIT